MSAASLSANDLIMVLPTYNEAENLEWIIGRIRSAVPGAHVLVVDDASPDGTGKIADRLQSADPQVHVLHRTDKEGLGKAYLAGFEWAIAEGFELIGEIDADGSHQPEQIPELLDAVHGADLVIGSRWVRGGEVTDWSVGRLALSHGGNLYTRLLLGTKVRDMTAGFRIFRRTALQAIDLRQVQSAGYVFQADMAFRAQRAGLRVVEVPISFTDRTRGESKMTGDVATESLRRITAWGIEHRRAQVRCLRLRAVRRWRHVSS